MALAKNLKMKAMVFCKALMILKITKARFAGLDNDNYLTLIGFESPTMITGGGGT